MLDEAIDQILVGIKFCSSVNFAEKCSFYLKIGCFWPYFEFFYYFSDIHLLLKLASKSIKSKIYFYFTVSQKRA